MSCCCLWSNKHNMPPPPVTLTFWPWKWCQVTCDVGYLCANFSLLRPVCSRLRPDVRDRQTYVRQTSDVHHRLMPPTLDGGGIINLCTACTVMAKLWALSVNAVNDDKAGTHCSKTHFTNLHHILSQFLLLGLDKRACVILAFCKMDSRSATFSSTTFATYFDHERWKSRGSEWIMHYAVCIVM